MFTGLIEEVGRVLRVTPRQAGAHIAVSAARVLDGTRPGDSVAVNGPCLTVVRKDSTSFVADCMPETLARTTLGQVKAGDLVNLERALAVGDRLGGHLVAGHVDAVAEIRAIDPRGVSSELRITLPDAVRPYVAPKGSIAVDGISLTVIDVRDEDFVVGIIPHTLGATTLGAVRPGLEVNLEADVLARYVHRAMMVHEGALQGADTAAGGPARETGAESLTEGFLRDHGFA